MEPLGWSNENLAPLLGPASRYCRRIVTAFSALATLRDEREQAPAAAVFSPPQMAEARHTTRRVGEPIL
jgi:hypothetical protein